MSNYKKKPSAEELPEGYCYCPETLLLDEASKTQYRVPKPKWHDCAYIHRRAGLVNVACTHADTLVEDIKEPEEKMKRWAQHFTGIMNYKSRLQESQVLLEAEATCPTCGHKLEQHEPQKEQHDQDQN